MGAARGRVRSWLAGSVAVVAAGLLGAGVVVGYRLPEHADDLAVSVMIVLVVTALVGVGALLAVRRSENPIGWLLLASGTFWAALVLGSTYAQYGWARTPHPPGTMLALWSATWTWLAAIAVLPFVLLLFPDGRPPSRRWRLVLRVGAVAVAGMVFAQWCVPWGPEGYHYDFALEAVNPLEVAALRGVDVEAYGLPLLAPLTLLALTSLVVRFRHAAPVVRQQMKWVLFGVAAALFVHLFVVTGAEAVGIGFNRIEDYSFGLVLGAFPVTIGLAVLRYRLYDIDRIISRAVAYAAVTLSLVGIYAAGVLGLGALVRTVAGEGSNDLVVAASTLAVAAAFGPVRRRVQRVVDRRFNRTRYDAARTVESFASRLREEVDLDVLVGDLRAVAVETMQPAAAAVWFAPRRPA